MKEYGYPSKGGRGDRFANGKPIDWPRCDFCGQVMLQVESEAYVACFECDCNPHQPFTLSFASCRYSDRYCAWEMLQGWPNEAP